MLPPNAAISGPESLQNQVAQSYQERWDTIASWDTNFTRDAPLIAERFAANVYNDMVGKINGIVKNPLYPQTDDKKIVIRQAYGVKAPYHLSPVFKAAVEKSQCFYPFLDDYSEDDLSREFFLGTCFVYHRSTKYDDGISKKDYRGLNHYLADVGKMSAAVLQAKCSAAFPKKGSITWKVKWTPKVIRLDESWGFTSVRVNELRVEVAVRLADFGVR